MRPLPNITMVCRRDSRSDDWKSRTACWRCKLECDGRSTSVTFMHPYEGGIPEVSDVLAGLATIAEDAQLTYEEWLEKSGTAADIQIKVTRALTSNSRLDKDEVQAARHNARHTYEKITSAPQLLNHLLGRNHTEFDLRSHTPESSEQIDASYRYQMMTPAQLEESCRNSSMLAHTTLRRHSNDEHTDRIESWLMAADTARDAWNTLKRLLQKQQFGDKAVRAERQARHLHETMESQYLKHVNSLY